MKSNILEPKYSSLYIMQRDWFIEIKSKKNISFRKMAIESGINPSTIQRFVNPHDVEANWHIKYTTIQKVVSKYELTMPNFKL